jgi:hypothetical protein
LLVVALIAAFAAGCGSGDEEATTTVTVTETETVTRTVTTVPSPAAPAAGCSAAGLSPELPADADLPELVAEVREEIAAAAVACDYERLQELALEQGTGFTFSYGAETSAADFWAGAEERGEEVMRILVDTLRQDGHSYQGNWVWPTAYADAPSLDDWQALAGIYTQEQIDSFRESGSFLGYRVGITPDGDWQFFVAGD